MQTYPEGCPYASVIIPTRNGMPLVEHCLRSVLAQEAPWPVEVIVIDSGSTDGTWELVESLPVERIRIAPETFNHGDTRNLGASGARGQFLVFTVQDAVPAGSRWLVSLVAACEPTGVAGSFSRQIVRPESSPITHFLCMGTIPGGQERDRKTLPPGWRLSDLHPEDRFRLATFQNVSSCIRRSVWIDHPFARLPYGEDIEWGKRAIEAGYSIVYEATSAVHHSHDRSALYTLKRAYADHHQAAELFEYVLTPTPWHLGRQVISGVLGCWRYIFRGEYSTREKLKSVAATPVYVAALTVGQYWGASAFRRASHQEWAKRLDRALRAGV